MLKNVIADQREDNKKDDQGKRISEEMGLMGEGEGEGAALLA